MSIFLRKYATATTIYFPLIASGTVNFSSTATMTTADMLISVDGAAFSTSSVAIVNVGSFGYSYTCRAGTEMTGKTSVLLTINTGTVEQTMMIIETYGNSAAQHTFDFSIANQTVIASAGTVMLAASALSAGAVVAGAFSAGAFAAGFFSAGGVAAAALSAGAFAASFLSAGGIATAAITSAKIATGGLDPTNFAAGFLSAGGVAANAISAGGIATDAIDADALAADAVTEIWNKALVQPTAAPSITATALSGLSWVHALSLLTITQNSVLQSVYQTDGATLISSSTISDDGTLFTRTKFTA